MGVDFLYQGEDLWFFSWNNYRAYKLLYVMFHQELTLHSDEKFKTSLIFFSSISVFYFSLKRGKEGRVKWKGATWSVSSAVSNQTVCFVVLESIRISQLWSKQVTWRSRLIHILACSFQLGRSQLIRLLNTKQFSMCPWSG